MSCASFEDAVARHHDALVAFMRRDTQLFKDVYSRREDGEWKIVHRHADPLPDSDATRRQLTRFLGSSGDGDSQAPRSR